MKLVNRQEQFGVEFTLLKRAITLPPGPGNLLFVGIFGSLKSVSGKAVLPLRDDAKKAKGLVLFLSDVRFKVNTARELTPNIKFFIDGIETLLARHVLILGCPTDQAKSNVRFILCEDRWPNPKVAPTDPTILIDEQKKEV